MPPGVSAYVGLKLSGAPARLNAMGRFSTTVEFYSRYREPYPPSFFKKVAEQIGLRGNETLLDVGCGPGLLAIGFAPYIGHGTGLDPEPTMLAAAKSAAKEAGVALKLIHETIEQFADGGTFDMVTIGRAIHWLDRETTCGVLERIVAEQGRIVTCGATTVESTESPWKAPYEAVRKEWAADKHEEWYRIDPRTWFAGSAFAQVGTVSVGEHRQVTIPELIGRALSKSNTSPAVLGERRAEFEAALASALEPFAQNGILQEEIVARGSIFGRQPRHSS